MKNEPWKKELYHHGILGMRWGKRNGPPYPLSPDDHSASEKKAGWRKSLTAKQKKYLMIGGVAVAAGAAAILAYKYTQINKSASSYKQAVNIVNSMISQHDTMLSDLRNSSNAEFGKKWAEYRTSISDISNKIDKLPNVDKNPLVSKDLKNKSSMKKAVTKLYKDLSNASVERNNIILDDIRKGSTDNAQSVRREVTNSFKPETFVPETFAPETFEINRFEPETLTIGEDFILETLKR